MHARIIIRKLCCGPESYCFNRFYLLLAEDAHYKLTHVKKSICGTERRQKEAYA